MIWELVSQLWYSIFITNNHGSFHLWWKENLVKYQKVSKYYVHDCRCCVRDLLFLPFHTLCPFYQSEEVCHMYRVKKNYITHWSKDCHSLDTFGYNISTVSSDSNSTLIWEYTEHIYYLLDKPYNKRESFESQKFVINSRNKINKC